VEPRLLDETRLLDIGDIQCACGLAFRYALTSEGPTLWPQNSRFGFSPTPLEGDICIRCSTSLAGLIPHPPKSQPAAA
jgi:hypothetical protein